MADKIMFCIEIAHCTPGGYTVMSSCHQCPRRGQRRQDY